MRKDCNTGFLKRLTTVLGITAAVTTVGLSGQVQAQEGSGASLALEEIVVTARRREESLVDVPVSISVVNADFLQEQNILNTADLFMTTPGVDYREYGRRSGNTTTIRGITPGGQSSLNQKVTILLDGVPITGNPGTFTQFLDLQQIEVLRGPQSAAFGRATFAGAINYVTKDPGNEFSGTVRTTRSDMDRNILGVNFNGPITDNLGFTLDLFEEDFRGPGTDAWQASQPSSDIVYDLGSTSTQHMSGKLKFTPNDFFDAELRFSRRNTDEGPTNQRIPGPGVAVKCNNVVTPGGKRHIQGEWNCPMQTAQQLLYHDLTWEYPYDASNPNGSTNYLFAKSQSVLDPEVSRDQEQISGEFTFSFDNGSQLQAIVSSATDDQMIWGGSAGSPGYSTSVMGMYNPMLTFNMAAPSGADKEDYVDVRWVSPDDASLRLMVGYSSFSFHYDATVYSQYAAVLDPALGQIVGMGMAISPSRRSDQTTEATGLYGSVGYDLSDRTTVSFEGRFQSDNLTSTDIMSGRTVNRITRSFQPRLAINHALNDDLSIYGQLSSATGPARANPVFMDATVQRALQAANAAGAIEWTADTFMATDEEVITNFEVGLKGSVLDGRLQFAAAAYIIDWQDMLLGERFDLGGLTVGTSGKWNDGTHSNGEIFNRTATFYNGIYMNFGQGDLSGVELEGNFLLNDRWSMRGSLALQNNTYGSHCDIGAYSTYGVASDCRSKGVPGTKVDGNEIEANSDTQATLSVRYQAPLAENWQWGGVLSMNHAGASWLDIINYASLPAISSINGQVNFANDNWDITIYGNNLTDETSPTLVREWREQLLRGDSNTWLYSQRWPREIGLRLNYSF